MAEVAAERVPGAAAPPQETEHKPTLCNRCEKTDNHPKVHVWGNWIKNPDAQEVVVVRDPSFHNDCLPEEWVSKYEGDPTHARMLEMRRAAIEDGLRGDDLRAHGATLDDDNDPAIAEAYAAAMEVQP